MGTVVPMSKVVDGSWIRLGFVPIDDSIQGWSPIAALSLPVSISFSMALFYIMYKLIINFMVIRSV